MNEDACKPEVPAADGVAGASSAPSRQEFRWQSFFQRSSDPIFILSRRRRLLFVNKAWERLTGLSAAMVRGIPCTRSDGEIVGPWEEALPRLLCPPPEVRRGRSARTRRPALGTATGHGWWDIDFVPLHDGHGLLGVLGKITPLPAEEIAPARPLPAGLATLRERMLREHQFAAFPAISPRLRTVLDQARLASQTRVPALIVGEPGSGKLWLARAIHQESPSREQTFAALDCPALPPEALAAALFGEGGLAHRNGMGTLYLKEPSRLPRELQDRLVRGAAQGSPRVLAGCSVDPLLEVRAGRLLEEWHACLATLVIVLPPLRERALEFPHLLQRLLDRANSDGGRCVTSLTPDAGDVLRAYAWPGNLRELYATLQSARFRATGDRIEADNLPAHVRLAVGLDRTAAPPAERILGLDHVLEEVERRLVQMALRQARRNKSKAAELLSISRPRLLRRMKELGIMEQEAPPEA